MNAKPIDGPMKWLGIAFAGYVFGWILIFVLPEVLDSDESAGNALLLAFAVLFASGITYLICLGKVAARTGRSWIIWVGLTVLFSPFSYLFSAPIMQSKVKKDAEKAALAT